MKKESLLSICLSGAIMVLLLVLVAGVTCQAAEVRYPIPCYEGEELAKVREWEKTWVGKRINNTSIDEVKEFIHEEYYKLAKQPEKWGKIWFDIVPYQQLMPTPGDIKFTKQYSAGCEIGPDENLLNYISGTPFANPKSAIEMMYNYDNLNFGDNAYNHQDMFLIDGRRKYDRKLVAPVRQLFYSGRREIPPLPEMPKNKKGVYRAAHSEFLEPASFKGTRGLSIKWINRSRDYGDWTYSSATRRVTRRSTAQRQSSIAGSDGCYDDTFTYQWAVAAQNYKLLGRKELLMPRHQDMDQLVKLHKEGQCLFTGHQRERINLYVVEAVHKNPNYLYSKSIYYIDPETWFITFSDKYDRKGRLWKIFDSSQQIVKSLYNDSLLPIVEFILIADVQRVHATGATVLATVGETGTFFDPGYYSPRALLKWGY